VVLAQPAQSEKMTDLQKADGVGSPPAFSLWRRHHVGEARRRTRRLARALAQDRAGARANGDARRDSDFRPHLTVGRALFAVRERARARGSLMHCFNDFDECLPRSRRIETLIAWALKVDFTRRGTDAAVREGCFGKAWGRMVSRTETAG